MSQFKAHPLTAALAMIAALVITPFVGSPLQAIAAQEKPPEAAAPQRSGELSRKCIRLFLDGFDRNFKSQSRMVMPDCYSNPNESIGIEKLAEAVKANPKEARNIALIVRSWTDNRPHCIVKQTAYAAAMQDVAQYLAGSISFKEASRGTFEGSCGTRQEYTTSCETRGDTIVCYSRGGGLPSSRSECTFKDGQSRCTFTGG